MKETEVVHAVTPATVPAVSGGGAPLRVLHLLPDLERGGGQQVLLRSLRYLDAERFQHHVVYFGPPEELKEPFAAAAKLTCIPSRGMASVRAVRRLVRAEGIDLLHVNGTPVDKLHGGLAAWYEGRPLLWTLHGMCPAGGYWKHAVRRPHPRRVWRTLRRGSGEVVERFLDRRTVGRVLAVSDTVLESWRPYLDRVGIPAERICVSYNGVPLEEYDTPANRAAAERLRSELGLGDAWPILLMIGRLNEGKGQHHLVHLLAEVRRRHPKVRLLLAGDGTAAHRAWFRQALAEAGTSENVLWLGARNDVPDLLALSDLYVFASATEGFPLSVLEALAAGRPVAAFHLPALERIVRAGENGLLVPPRRADLAAAICALCDDRARLDEHGRRSREIVRDGYSMQAAAGRLAAAYETLMSERRGA